MTRDLDNSGEIFSNRACLDFETFGLTLLSELSFHITLLKWPAIGVGPRSGLWTDKNCSRWDTTIAAASFEIDSNTHRIATRSRTGRLYINQRYTLILVKNRMNELCSLWSGFLRKPLIGDMRKFYVELYKTWACQWSPGLIQSNALHYLWIMSRRNVWEMGNSMYVWAYQKKW